MPKVPVESTSAAVQRAHEPAFAASIDAVAAHGVLDSSSVVLLGSALLDEQWASLSAGERRDIAARVHRHAVAVSAGLTQLTRSGVLLAD